MDEVLDCLIGHFKNIRNKGIQCCYLLCCKQADGESFSDFYVCLKNLAEKLFMTLQVNYVPFLRTRRNNDSRRRPTPSRLHQHSLPPVLHANPQLPAWSRRFPATDGTCTNCGCKNSRARTLRCPAKDEQCHNCGKTRHYNRCCKKKTRARIALQIPIELPLLSTATPKARLLALHQTQPLPQLSTWNNPLTGSPTITLSTMPLVDDMLYHQRPHPNGHLHSGVSHSCKQLSANCTEDSTQPTGHTTRITTSLSTLSRLAKLGILFL
ncbi:hypothetical protein SK128_013139 [Halocaridina rubra]|uniref:CCHC-type domain-containing protein n=1 Tax=Halocaridina rubra TaxID=373956 RepID=A0AAN8XQ98_HALRR